MLKDTERDGRICAMPGLEPPMDPPTPQQATTQHIDSRSTPLPPDSHQRCRNPAAAQPRHASNPNPAYLISTSTHPTVHARTHAQVSATKPQNHRDEPFLTGSSKRQRKRQQISNIKQQTPAQPSPDHTIPYQPSPHPFPVSRTYRP